MRWRRGPRLTRRGHYLLAFGLVQLGLGAAYVPASNDAGSLTARFLPAVVYVSVSALAGLLSVVAAFVRPQLERAAFGALAVAAAMRALSYAAVVLATGQVVGLTGVLAFGLLLRVHLLVAGWPDPPPSTAVTLTQEQLELLAEELRRRHGRR